MTTSDPVAAIKADFRNFYYLVLKHLRLPDPTTNQYDICEFLQHGPPRRMVKAFRGIGKSWLSAAYVDWRLLGNPNLNILVFSASKSRSDAFTTFCLRLIDDMPILAHLRPKENQRRSMVAFDVGPAGASQTPSVYSVGIFGQATGHRADIIIVDDVEIPNNSETVLQREKLKERINEFEAILKPGGEIIYLGTDQTEDSVYRDLPDRGYTVRIWPARYPDAALVEAYQGALAPKIAEKVAADPTLVGKPAEPVRFGEQSLQAREMSGGKAWFALQFMLDPRLSDADLYPLKMADLLIHPLDSQLAPERLIWAGSPEQVIQDLPVVGMRGDRLHRAVLPSTNTPYLPYTGTVMAIDPAGRGADETGYAIVSVLNGTMFLRDAGGLKGYETPTLEALALLAKKYEVNHVIVEPNFGDGMFNAVLQPVMARIYPVKIEDAERSAGQKELRIIDTLEPVISGHRLVVDRGLVQRDYDSTAKLPVEKAQQYRLFYQLTHITRLRGALHHDDRIDALALAVRYWSKAMTGDVEKAAARGRVKRLEAELKKFAKHVFGRTPQPAAWADTGHG